MLFTQTEFAALLGVVLGCSLLVRSWRARKACLLFASWYFYAYWDWRCLGLLLVATFTGYGVGLALGRTEASRRRRALLLVSLSVQLGLLGVFKYHGFFVASLGALLAPLGLRVETLSLVLPVGISFYTFQTLGYTIDVYWRRQKPCASWLDFALFVAFFPQLVAGPIQRARDLLPQFASPRGPTWERAFLGGRQFAFGLFKKVFIADRLAGFVDEVFRNAGAYDGPTTWLAVLAFAVQIYSDFSGYSDMAIGVARLLGFDLRANFRHPYLATNIADFWRRWHISLSSWIWDYVFTPLLSFWLRRVGRPERDVADEMRLAYPAAVLPTMLLCGLWHGAAWTFVAWGAWHGLALAAHRTIAPRLDGWWPRRSSRTGRAARAAVSRLATLLVVVVGWVFFRAASFTDAARLLRRMFTAPAGVAWPYPFALAAVVIVAAWHAAQAGRLARWRELPRDAWYTPVVLSLLIWLVFAFPPRGSTPFIYFQF